MEDNARETAVHPVLRILTGHWLSVLGTSLVTIAACSWLLLLVLRPDAAAADPYMGILIFFAIPIVFFVGLALIPAGVWLARRRIAAGLSRAPDRRVVLRRVGIFFGVMTVVNIVIGSQVTYRAVTSMESPQFCGQSCHIMKPQFVANQGGVHRNVHCVECHVVPGAAGFLEAKMNGTRQLIEVTLGTYPRPVPPALQTDRLVSSEETCERCHSRAVNSGRRLRVLSKFKDDETNTPIQTVLMMNVGGGATAAPPAYMECTWVRASRSVIRRRMPNVPRFPGWSTAIRKRARAMSTPRVVRRTPVERHLSCSAPTVTTAPAIPLRRPGKALTA